MTTKKDTDEGTDPVPQGTNPDDEMIGVANQDDPSLNTYDIDVQGADRPYPADKPRPPERPEQKEKAPK